MEVNQDFRRILNELDKAIEFYKKTQKEEFNYIVNDSDLNHFANGFMLAMGYLSKE